MTLVCRVNAFHQGHLLNWISAVPLLFAYYQTMMFLSDYGVCWTLSEGAARSQLVSWGFPNSVAALARIFNWPLFEYEPRLTRPLSTFVELFDAPFRAGLWQFVRPHPSLSLTWLFSLVVAPLLLFLLLRRLGVRTWVAMLATSLYVANPGVLSLEVMLFRSGKPMANAAILLCLWFAAAELAHVKEASLTRGSTIRLISLCTAAFVTCLFDEVGLIAIPALALLFPGVVFRTPRTSIAFALVPIAYIATVWLAMPALARFAGWPVPPRGYEPASSLIKLMTFQMSSASYETVAYNIVENARVITLDTLGLIDPRLPGMWGYYVIYGLVVALALFAVARALWIMARPGAMERRPFAGVVFGGPVPINRVAAVVLIAFAYEGLLMSISIGPVGERVWGLYYYGVFCAIFLIVLAALVCEAIAPAPILACLLTLAVVSGTTLIFPATNEAYKTFHYYPHKPELLEAMFANSINRFTIPKSNGALLRSKTIELWNARNALQPVRNVPVELSYALYELKLARDKIPCEFRSYTFDLTWAGDAPRVECQH